MLKSTEKQVFVSSVLTQREMDIMKLHCETQNHKFIIEKSKICVHSIYYDEYFALQALELHCLTSV